MSSEEKIQKTILGLITYVNEKKEGKKINLDNIRIGEVFFQEGLIGCVSGYDGWYVYEIGDRYESDFIGPFDDIGIVKALASKLLISRYFEDLKFTNEELNIYIKNHYDYEEFTALKKNVK